MANHYPCMKSDESEVLAAFYETHPDWEKRAVYCVRLDTGDPEWPAATTESERAMWRKITAKRPDVVFEFDDRVVAVEVTPRISKAALGGVMLYRQMMRPHYPLDLAIVPMIISGWDDPAIRGVAEAAGIEVAIAQPPSWQEMRNPPPFNAYTRGA